MHSMLRWMTKIWFKAIWPSELDVHEIDDDNNAVLEVSVADTKGIRQGGCKHPLKIQNVDCFLSIAMFLLFCFKTKARFIYIYIEPPSLMQNKIPFGKNPGSALDYWAVWPLSCHEICWLLFQTERGGVSYLPIHPLSCPKAMQIYNFSIFAFRDR